MKPDPILVKALRSLVVAQRNAKSAGMELTRADADAFIRDETKGKYSGDDAKKYLSTIDSSIGARNLGRSFVQGAAMNWADELYGLFAGEGNKEDMRLREELFRQEHPVADAAAGVGGALATVPLIPGGGAMSLGRAAARGAAIGFTSGAISGAGRGEGAADRAEKGITTALLSGAAGAAIPAGAAVVRSMRDPAQRAAARIEDAFQKSGGIDAMRGRVQSFAAAGKGAEVMTADLSPYLRAATDFAANASDDVLVPLARKGMARQRETSERMLGDARELLGGEPDAALRLEQLKQGTRDFATGPEGYDALAAANPQVAVDVPQQLGAILEHPTVKGAWHSAQRLNLLGPMPKQIEPDFRQLQSLKIRLDNAVGGLYKQGLVPDAQALSDARDKIVEIARTAVKGYGAVDAGYAARKELEAMNQAGADAFNTQDARGFERLVQSLTNKPEALQELRTGIASGLITKLRGVGTNRGVAKELMDSSIDMQKKLEVVFGDKATFDEFMKRASLEADMAATQGTYGNSATVRRLTAQGLDPSELGVSAAENMLAGGVKAASANAMSGLFKASRAKMARSTAKAMGPWLHLQGAENIDELLKNWSMRSPLVGKVGTTALPRAGASLFDQF